MKKGKKKKQGPSLGWEDSIRVLITGLMGFGVTAYADVPSGILGGQVTGSSDAYGSFVLAPAGTLVPISSLPANGIINSVSINQSGYSLVGGGLNAGSGYAALISPSGQVTSLPTGLTNGNILGVAINQTNNGLIAGNSDSSGYAAQIAPDGTIIPLTLSISTTYLQIAALNDSGVGLIGGEGVTNLAPYGGYVAVNGDVTTITGIPNGSPGYLNSVSINALGNGIVGGSILPNSYAAFVSDSAVSTTLNTPGGDGYIISVAINDSGLALIGGASSSNAYASYATFGSDSLTNLFTSPFSGYINSVGINSAGAGIVGGQNESNLYAALVQPNGNVTSIISDSIPGQINWVAINEAGVGLIGGQVNSTVAYAALVAPNGSLTLLDVSAETFINSVDLNDVTSGATPQSTGSYLSPFYMQLAAASALEARFVQKNRIWDRNQTTQLAQGAMGQVEELLVSTEENFALGLRAQKKNEKLSVATKKNSIWIAPFGDYVNLKSQGKIPNYTNKIGGALLAYDHQEASYMVGASLGYAFNYIHYSESLGHGKIQEEMGCLYGAYYANHFRMNVVLWGGFYQFKNERHTLAIITSKGKTHGWILDPHMEMASFWEIGQNQLYFVEPFFMLDWVNSWQKHYTETGSAGFNLNVKDLYGSLLQSEVGLRFYEKFQYNWGDFRLEEKVSYINQTPFNLNSTTTSFVSSASTFPIAVASTKVENLAALQLIGSFIPENKSYPFGGISMQATGNRSYQSYFLSVFIGMDF